MDTEVVRLLVSLLAVLGACLLGIVGWVYSRDRAAFDARLTYLEQNMVTRDTLDRSLVETTDKYVRQFLSTP